MADTRPSCRSDTAGRGLPTAMFSAGPDHPDADGTAA